MNIILHGVNWVATSTTFCYSSMGGIYWRAVAILEVVVHCNKYGIHTHATNIVFHSSHFHALSRSLKKLQQHKMRGPGTNRGHKENGNSVLGTGWTRCE